MKVRITTLKKFVRENKESLMIKVEGSFDGMTDMVEMNHQAAFKPVQPSRIDADEHTLGFSGIWLVLQSRDYIRTFENETMTGFEVSNSCGYFTIAIKK